MIGPTRPRGLLALLTAAVCLAVVSLSAVAPIEGRQLPEIPAQPLPPVTSGPATLPQDRGDARKLAAIREYIQTQSWNEVTRALQALLDEPEDSFQRVEEIDGEGKTVVRWVSVREEAERMLAALPPAGRETYRLRHDPLADALFKAARARHDMAALTDLVCRFRHTRAGEDALIELATRELDRGHADVAALCFRRLLAEERNDRPPALLFRAALAHQAVGERAEAERLWGQVARRAGGSLRLGGREVKLEEARAEFDRWGQKAASGDWPLFRADARRTAAGPVGEPLLEPRWQRPLTGSAIVRAWHDEAAVDLLPAATPIAVAGRLVYRSYTGLHALDLESGRDAWHTPSPLALETALADPGKKVQLEDWHKRLKPLNLGFLPFVDSTTGTLSSDGQRVFAVEDLPLPPPPLFLQQLAAGQPRPLGPLKDFAFHNRLRALDLGTGAVLWEAGGRAARGIPPGPLEDAFFLGPVLPLAGGLFALVEQKKELRLVCLDPAHGTVRWSQHLAGTTQSPMLDLRRRLCATHLAYGEGVLVCPTGAGVVLAFDPLTRNLLWAAPYRSPATPEDNLPLEPTALPRVWQGAAPLIHDGSVVFADTDSAAIDCLRLRDGKRLWSAPREADDLYVGCVTDDLVLVVGRSSCRALNRRTGVPLWQHETGEPSGLGVLGGKVFYLPLRAGAVLAVDLAVPRQSARLECRSHSVTPGNLILQDGTLISQTGLTLTVYTQVGALQERLKEQLARAPRDPAARFDRGRLRLDRGDFPGAVEDLHVVLEQDSAFAGPAREILYRTLTQWLHRDFTAAERHLDEYRALCRVPIPADADAERQQELRTEERRRQQNWYGLLAHGRESQGRPADAFRAYLDLLSVTEPGVLLPATDDPALVQRAEVWAARELAGLWSRATPEGRAALRVSLQEQLRGDAANRVDADSLVRLADLAAALPGEAGADGWALRVRLLEAAVDTTPRRDVLALVLRLTALERTSPTPALAARLLRARARLLVRHGLVEDAAECFLRLGDVYARVVLPDGRTGAEHLADARADRRLLAAFDPPRLAPASGKWISSIFKGNFPSYHGAEANRVVTEISSLPDYVPNDPGTAPSCRRLRLFRENNHNRLIVTGPDGAPHWSVTVPSLGQGADATGGFEGYRIVGHLALVHVGCHVVALDLIDHRLLWVRNLLISLPMARVGGENVRVTPAGPATTLEVIAPNTERVLERAGLLGSAGSGGDQGDVDTLYLQTPRFLTALDPVTGQPRWRRTEPGPLLTLFSDATHLCLADCSSEPAEGLGPVRSFKVFRQADGVAVAVPDCRDACAGFQRALGTGLLLQEGEPKDGLKLRLYDPVTGKDRWRQAFPAGSQFLATPTAPHLLAVAAPDGVVTVVDLAAGRTLARLEAPAEHMVGLVNGTLLLDATQFYVILNGQPGLVVPGPGSIRSWFGGSLDVVTLDGPMHAFPRGGGRPRWTTTVRNQNLLIDRTNDSPLFLCATGKNRQDNGKMTFTLALQAIDRNSGKVTMFPPERDHNPQLGEFHTLRVDPIAGTVDLIAANWVWRHTLTRTAPAK